MSNSYEFIRNMWGFGKLTAAEMQTLVERGYITQAESDEIQGVNP